MGVDRRRHVGAHDDGDAERQERLVEAGEGARTEFQKSRRS
jgi:hypothetical protein